MWCFDIRARNCLKMKYLGSGGNRSRYCTYVYVVPACLSALKNNILNYKQFFALIFLGLIEL